MAIIGIDLGTSDSSAAVMRGGRPIIVPSAGGVTLGGKAFPSYVAVTADGQLLVGGPARRDAGIRLAARDPRRARCPVLTVGPGGGRTEGLDAS
jgi:molecular chaperone DnaK (HSP70)